MHVLRGFYPEIKPYHHGWLQVSELHSLYFEECGNPNGKPVLLVHGGPGAGTGENERRFFDPDAYRIGLFHQRGGGQSKPHGALEENSTWHLVSDMERLREHLGIERWMLFGGSWGSTLSLAYSQAHPNRVSEMVLRGIFLMRKLEIDWLYQEGASMIYPDAFEDYLEAIPADERHDLVAAYYRRLTHEDPEIQWKAALAWSLWEGRISFLLPNKDFIDQVSDRRLCIALARIECHFFMNRGFLKRENQFLEDIDKIRHIPAIIVHGRYDVLCPAKTAWELHRAWPEADLKIVQSAGHSAMDPCNLHELILATDRFRG